MTQERSLYEHINCLDKISGELVNITSRGYLLHWERSSIELSAYQNFSMDGVHRGWIQEFCKMGPRQGVWGTEVPQKLKQNVKLVYKF